MERERERDGGAARVELPGERLKEHPERKCADRKGAQKQTDCRRGDDDPAIKEPGLIGHCPRLRDAIELEPRSRVAHLFAASAYIEQGSFDDAVAEAGAARALTPSNTQARALEAYANAGRGKHSEAEAALAELLELSKERYVSPYHVAIACNGLNEPAEAIARLERGFEEHDPMMVFLYVEPKWRNLRGEPRMVRLLKRMKFL